MAGLETKDKELELEAQPEVEIETETDEEDLELQIDNILVFYENKAKKNLEGKLRIKNQCYESMAYRASFSLLLIIISWNTLAYTKLSFKITKLGMADVRHARLVTVRSNSTHEID